MQECQLATHRNLHHARPFAHRVGAGDGLGGLRGELGEELVGGHPHAASKLQQAPHLGADVLGDRDRVAEQTLGTGDVEERLVERQGFDVGGDRLEDLVHLGAHPAVEVVVAGQEDRLRAQPPGPA